MSNKVGSIGVFGGTQTFLVTNNPASGFTAGNTPALVGFIGDNGMVCNNPPIILSDQASGDLCLTTFDTSGTMRFGIGVDTASLLELTASALTVNVPTTFASGNVNIGGLETSSITNANLLTTNTLRVVSNAEVDGHLLSVGTAPTVAVGAGSGSGATAAIVAGSTDVRGAVSLGTGTSTAANSDLFTVTFHAAYTAIPWVVIGRNDGQAVGAFYLSAISDTAFTVRSAVALTASVPYTLTFHAIG